jgi:hypothetical protein
MPCIGRYLMATALNLNRLAGGLPMWRGSL